MAAPPMCAIYTRKHQEDAAVETVPEVCSIGLPDVEVVLLQHAFPARGSLEQPSVGQCI